MLVSKWKNKSMAACMGLLILICLLALLGWGLKTVSTKFPKLRNYHITSAVLPNEPSTSKSKIHINWAQLYPFDNLSLIHI